MSSRYDVAVVGAGHNGLTTAAFLAQRGKKVLVCERRDQIGGLAAGEEFHPGYRTPGVLHDTTGVRTWVIDDLKLRRHGLKLHPERRPIFVPQKDGPGYVHWHDPEQAREEISRFSTPDAERYKEYRAYLRRVARVVRRVFDAPPPDLRAVSLTDLWDLGSKAVSLRLLGKTDMMELFRITPMCVADWVEEWFDTELIQATLASQAILHSFTGPRSSGTTLNLLMAETLSGNGVIGGPQALVSSLLRADSNGNLEIRADTAVQEIQIDSRRVAGVVLDGGEVVETKKVAASCDPKSLFLDLLPANLLPIELEQNVLHYRARGTTAKINLALSRYPEFAGRPDLRPAFIRTGESLDALERAFDAAKYREISAEPILDIYVPTIEAPELAPDGHHVFSVLVHFAPYSLEAGWSEEQKEKLYQRVIETLSAYSPNIQETVVGRQVVSPIDLETIYGVNGGHLLHGEHSTDQLLMRPTPECLRYATPFDGLFLCGSGSHPGGGITCAPGALAARVLRP